MRCLFGLPCASRRAAIPIIVDATSGAAHEFVRDGLSEQRREYRCPECPVCCALYPVLDNRQCIDPVWPRALSVSAGNGQTGAFSSRITAAVSVQTAGLATCHFFLQLYDGGCHCLLFVLVIPG